MQFLTGVCLVLALASLSSCQSQDAIVRNDFEGPNPDGSYKWAIQTEGGVFHEQRGGLEPSSSGEPALVVEGQYQYVAPDGQTINVLYKADENGFQPTGDHLPTPPPIPPAIARALAYLATKPPPTDSDY
ncbi:endocuticle structural glycoprotein ABD-4-like [Hyposmocoma kahamanoa]|uniref:endocuticle structural glycoprotein ABD-4-like n=1 Tax=Hyposmocoma kahamanoa TaxID=1477025 RepID=UPI000E6D635A|nr:endocuticle structural glycoprotein ABD-4-like [Hyposmocoma kahamanoa]